MSAQILCLTEEMTKRHTEKLKNWFNLLNDVMPKFFFNTFDAEQLQMIMPALFNIERHDNIQQIFAGNSVILVYLKSEANNMAVTARMMKDHDIFSASIHESVQHIVVNSEPRTLVIEHYVVDRLSMKMSPAYSKAEVKKAYRQLYKNLPEELNEIYDRINWEAVTDLSVDRVAERLSFALRAQKQDWIDLDIESVDKDELRITMALSNCPSKGFYYKIAECLSHYGFEITRRYSRTLTFQDKDTEFNRMPVAINTTYIKKPKGRDASKKLEDILWELPHIKWTQMDDLYYDELVVKKGWKLSDTNLMRAAGEFAHSQFSYIDRNAYNSHDISRMIVLYEEFLKEYLTLFETRFKPGLTDREKKYAKLEKKISAEIDRINTGMHEKDTLVKNIFKAILNFFDNIKKTNFYVKEKSALSFRLTPQFMDFYQELSPGYLDAFPKRTPYGIFYFLNHNTVGFQVRFSKIARGGWRTVIPRNIGHELEKMDMYGFTKDEIFREVFVLAHTQHMKNKDIYEGGSKMICLLKQDGKLDTSSLYECQRSVARSFVNLINYDKKGKLLNPAIVDHLGEFEIIEIGPDENMFDTMIKWLGSYAEEVGYTLGGGLISGKPETGFNHKDYGVTSLGVHQFLLKTLDELGVDPGKDVFSVKISGGPFGDVAGNELALLLQKKGGKYIYPNLKIVAITDGPAAAFDPDGLDRDELLTMVKAKNLDAFNPQKLSGEGAYMIYSEPQVKDGHESHLMYLVKNKKVIQKQVTRDDFMEMFQGNLTANYADIFIPCGGRPSTINASNWDSYFPNGKAASKAIVEGANSYITPDARALIQDQGVWIVKDASANKCGVITSSYEILSGLILGTEEFVKLKDKLAKEVLNILVERAQKEAEWLFFQFKKSGGHLTDLTEKLSVHINDKNSEISEYLESHPELVDKKIILQHLPETFGKLDKKLLDKLPEDYKKAIVSVELACRIIYKSAQNLKSEISSVL